MVNVGTLTYSARVDVAAFNSVSVRIVGSWTNQSTGKHQDSVVVDFTGDPVVAASMLHRLADMLDPVKPHRQIAFSQTANNDRVSLRGTDGVRNDK